MTKDLRLDLVLDIRTVAEWSDGHGINAKNIPLEQLSNRLSELMPYKDKKVIVVCQSGARSELAVTFLKQAGFSNISNGGSWQNYQ